MNPLEITLTNALVNAISSSLQTYNVNLVQNNGLSTSISNIATEIAKEIILSTSLQSNSAINSIPLNTVGPYNPLDLVSQNRNASYVSGIISPAISTTIDSQINALVSSKISSLISFNTSSQFQNIAGLGNLKSQILLSLQPVLSNSISQAISSFSSGLFNKNVVTIPLVGNIGSLFNTADPTIALQNYTLSYNNNISLQQ